jgi:hypothetical protein
LGTLRTFFVVAVLFMRLAKIKESKKGDIPKCGVSH